MGRKRKIQKSSTGGSTSSSAVEGAKPTSVNVCDFPLSLLNNGKQRVASHQQPNSVSKLQVWHPDRIWVLPDFFTKRECQEWIDFAESSGGLEYTAHPATKYIAHRECYRLQQANATVLAQRIYQRLATKLGGYSNLTQAVCPNDLVRTNSNDSLEPIGCNPNLRLYKYTKGHAFGRHVDGSNSVEGTGDTLWTVLIYLSECRGGATRFYTSAKKSVAFDPVPGSILLHLHGDHCLEHEAEVVTQGTKYVLRTDLVVA